VAEGDADKGLFPLKMRDSAQNACFAYLRQKGLLPADDSDSDGGRRGLGSGSVEVVGVCPKLVETHRMQTAHS
jgi:hypothetical protein